VAQVLGLRNVIPASVASGGLTTPSLGLDVPWADGSLAGPVLAYFPPDRLLPVPCRDGWLSIEATAEEILSLPRASMVQLSRATVRLHALVTRVMIDTGGIVPGATIQVSIDPRTIHLLPPDGQST
jgi:hypothetical protein